MMEDERLVVIHQSVCRGLVASCIKQKPGDIQLFQVFCGGKFTSGGPDGPRTHDLFEFNKALNFYPLSPYLIPSLADAAAIHSR